MTEIDRPDEPMRWHVEGLATDALLDKLHGMTAAELLHRIESGSASSGDIRAAIALLKDNGIRALPTEGNQLLALADAVDADFETLAPEPSEPEEVESVIDRIREADLAST